MNKDLFFQELNEINEKLNMKRIEEAVDFATVAHEGQYRKSGEPYVTHPMNVALILARLSLDEDTIIAGLLHDVLEDTKYTYDDITERFGDKVADIVDGVTKIEQIKYESHEVQQAENFRKMLLAMSKDVRVILVKLADRLHNMRTLGFKRKSSVLKTANETFEIYVPIAQRLGIFRIKWELEDLAFKHKFPEEYEDINSKFNANRESRESSINEIINQISKELDKKGINHKIYGRAKNYYSIYKKIKTKNKTFEEIYDISAIRVIVDTVEQCYEVFGTIHSKWTPMPGRVKDYIAMPKPNLYQSLHTTLIAKSGKIFEVQIRTAEMHKVAEYGIAAHWRYKNQQDESKVKNLSWIDQMLKMQDETDTPAEFIDTVKMDLFTSFVYVFTPKGKVIELPEGSTPIDFAYKIHTHVGNSCIGAKVNGRIVPLNYTLKIGDIVEILTSKTFLGPSRDWLSFVKSSHAKSKIKTYFKKESKQENIEKGKDILERELKKESLTLKQVLNDEIVEILLDRFNMKNVDQVFASIGYGGITLRQIMPIIKEKMLVASKKENKVKFSSAKRSNKGVKINGVDNILIKFAKCCNPIHGDNIIGFITRGSGVTIHRSDCVNFVKSGGNKGRFIEAKWDEEDKSYHTAALKLISKNSNSFLNDITTILTNNNVPIRGINAKVNNNGISTVIINFDVRDTDELMDIRRKIGKLKNILEVYRL